MCFLISSGVRGQGASFSSEIYRKKVRDDISEEITNLDPNRAPFMRFLAALGNKKSGASKFEYLEETIKERKTLLNDTLSTVNGSASGTTLEVEDSNLYVAGDAAGVSGSITGAAATGIIAARGMMGG